MIRKVLLTMGMLLLMGSLGFAQDTKPTEPPTQHFTISGNVAGFTKAPTGAGAASILTAAMQITKTTSAGYVHIAIGDARWELGELAYTRPLSELVGTRLNSKLVFDATKIGITFTAGAGKLLQPTVNRIAETAGVHVSYPLSDHLSVQLIGVDVLHAGMLTGFITTNYTQAVSSGLNISF
jgi:hypothetical protein